MAKFTGSGKVKVNGQLCKTVPDSIEVMVGGKQRNAQMADDTFNWSEKPVAATVKCKFLLTDKFPMKTVNDLNEGLLEVELDIGKSFDLTEACRLGDPLGFTTSDGQVSAEFGGTMQLK
jgi:hypothetical protein